MATVTDDGRCAYCGKYDYLDATHFKGHEIDRHTVAKDAEELEQRYQNRFGTIAWH